MIKKVNAERRTEVLEATIVLKYREAGVARRKTCRLLLMSCVSSPKELKMMESSAHTHAEKLRSEASRVTGVDVTYSLSVRRIPNLWGVVWVGDGPQNSSG